MTGHELMALLESMSADELDMNLYVYIDGHAMEITADNLIVQIAPEAQ